MSDRPFPTAPEAERALLGSILQDPSILDEATIRPDDFYDRRHLTLYRRLQEMHARGAAIDLVTVPRAIQQSREAHESVPYVLQLPDHAPSTANWAHYEAMVLEASQRRTLIGGLQHALGLAWGEGDLADLRAMVEACAGGLELPGADSWVRMSELTQAAIEDIDARKDGSLPGWSTGIDALDDILAGLCAEDLIIIAARPSMGKTALALQVAEHVAEQGAAVGVFEQEMSTKSLVKRSMARRAGLDGNDMRRGRVGPVGWQAIFDAEEEIEKLDLFVIDLPGRRLRDIQASARQLARKTKLGLIVVDYLQIMAIETGRGENLSTAIGKVTGGLKNLARELGIPVLLLSQLNRDCEKRPDRRPRMSDLRESGSIEQDADVVVFLYRDEVYDEDSSDRGICEVNVVKQRNGPIGMVRVPFDGPTMRFGNSDEEEL